MKTVILNIDTALESASVSVAIDGQIVQLRTNDIQKDHAVFMHTAIKELLDAAGTSMQDLHAIAVTTGPGSYTGLRVGLSTAKGLCYALGLPLISINSLQLLAHAAEKVTLQKEALLCPMIDARRMEVFTALYDINLNTVTNPCAMILNDNSFAKELNDNKIIFCGNGSEKFSHIINHHNATFVNNLNYCQSLAMMSYIRNNESIYDDIRWSEPLYIKEHESVSTQPKS